MEQLIAALEDWAKRTRGEYVYKNVKADQILAAFKTLLTDKPDAPEPVSCPVLPCDKCEKLIQLNIDREAAVQQALNHILSGEYDEAYTVLDHIAREV